MLRTRLTVSVAALALLATACSSTTDQAGMPGRAPSEGATSQTPTPGSSARTTPTGSDAPGGATGAARPRATGQPTVVATRARPPAAGTYRYRQEGVSLFGEMPDEGTLRIGAADARGRQTHTRTVSEDEVTEQRIRFTADGVLLLAVTQTYGSGPLAQSYECAFDPPFAVVRLPLTVGDRWQASSSCGDLDVEFQARVLRTEQRRVAGQRVETVVIDATITASGDGVSQTTTSTSWLSPKHRLVVRSEQRSEGRQGTFSFRTALTEDLIDLRPR